MRKQSVSSIAIVFGSLLIFTGCSDTRNPMVPLERQNNMAFIEDPGPCAEWGWSRDEWGNCSPDRIPSTGDGGGDGGGGDHGGGGGSVEPPEEPCATGDPVVDSETVQDGFTELWQQSNYSPTTPQNERREVAGWIVQTANGFAVQPMTGAVLMPCGVDADGNPPPGTVGWVHTHPWSVGERQTSCPPLTIGGREVHFTYTGASSDYDDAISAQFGIPGYILDADGITKFDGTGATLARHDRCGY
jgi:hypothetical protein